MNKQLKSRKILKMAIGSILLLGATTATTFATIACSSNAEKRPEFKPTDKPLDKQYVIGVYQDLASGLEADPVKYDHALMSFNNEVFIETKIESGDVPVGLSADRQALYDDYVAKRFELVKAQGDAKPEAEIIEAARVVTEASSKFYFQFYYNGVKK